jgi:ribonuclease HI
LRINKPLIFLLWGNAARELEPIAKLYKHTCLCWTHPSPLANNKLSVEARFENSDHFIQVNKILKFPICWDPLEHIYVATDGACKDNGGSNARATFAVWIATGPLRNTTVSGVVAPFTYKFRDPNVPSKGFETTEIGIQPSNNRGEYLAWCWALLCLLRAHTRGRIDIISDCDLFIKTINEWLPVWQSKNTAQSHKNYDLIEIANTLLCNSCQFSLHRTI